MSTATLPEIAETIARLGAENGALRGQGGSMTDELQRQTREQRQEIEALRQIDDQLQKAIERERDLRKAAEAGREEWAERCRAEAAAVRKLETDLAAKCEQVDAVQEYLGAERRQVAALNGEVQRLTTNLADADREAQVAVETASESLRRLHGQLQAAENMAAEAIDSRAKAEEAYADCGRRNGELQGQLLTATAEAKLQANAAQKYLDMLRAARVTLTVLRDQFVDEDGEPEPCNLSVESSVALISTIDETLAATA
jgi:chromosome segregation ATPase